MKLYNLKDRPEYIKEFILICHEEWGDPWKSNEIENRIQDRINITWERLKKYPTLILLEGNRLIGFVSLLEYDCDERPNLTPWYATLYVKKEYRGKGLSKKLTDAIINEAKKLNYRKIYLKTTLVNFYEKFGFVYLEKMSNGEKIYFMDLKI